MATETGVQVFVGPANQLELGDVLEGPAQITLETINDSHQRIHFTIPSPTQELVDVAAASETAAAASATQAGAAATAAAGSLTAAQAAVVQAAAAAVAPTDTQVQTSVDAKVPPAVTAALAADGAPAAAAAAAAASAVTTELGTRSLVEAPVMPDGEDIIFGIIDSQRRRTWVEVAADGGPSSRSLEKLEGQGVVSMREMNDETTGLSFAILSADGQILEAEWDQAGKVTDRVLKAWAERMGATTSGAGKASETRLIQVVPDGAGNSQLVSYDRTTGAVVELTATGHNTNPQPVADGVIYDTAVTKNAVATTVWRADDGTIGPLRPVKSIACFGDSITAGVGGGATTYPGVLAGLTGVPVVNSGVSSMASGDIALRQGAATIALTFAGGSIPASGGIAVTVGPGSWRAGVSTTFGWAGVVAGVPGNLTHDAGANTWLFTRTASGTAVAVTPGVPFACTVGDAYRAHIQILWAGRNNEAPGTSWADVAPDTAKMVAHLTPFAKQYLVLSVTTRSTETAGTAAHTSIIGINAALAATYGQRFVDVRHYMIDRGLGDAGITPTAADLTAIAGDTIPPSLLADGLHFNAVAYQLIAQLIATRLDSQGWI